MDDTRPLGVRVKWKVKMTEEDTNELIRYETVTSPGLGTYWEIHFAQGSDAGQTELREVIKTPLGRVGRAALALIVFAAALRNIIVRAERVRSTLASLALAGGIAGGTLILAGNALSRATALASTDEEFVLDFAVSIAALRLRVLPRWLGWTGFVVAVLLPLGIVFVGFLVFAAWLIAASIALAVRPMREADQVPVPRES